MALIRGTDIRFSTEEKEAIMTRLRQVVESSYLMWGTQQEEFQKTMAFMAGRKYAMTYSHVTIAMEALFSILRPKIVAVQSNQFPSVIFAAQRQGARIVWVDIDPGAMCPRLPLAVHNTKPDVLVWQHNGGFISSEIEKVKASCKEEGVFFIEDASQALGTIKDGHGAGHWGDVSFISLSGTKFLTTGGQGGIVLFDDEAFWTPMFQRKVYGRSEMFQRGEWITKGWNAQMTETQAAVGNALVPFLDGWIAHRKSIAKVYEELFDDTSLRPCGDRSGRPNWYKYPVMLPAGTDRAKFKKYLLEHEVECSSEIYPQPTYAMGSFRDEFAGVSLPGTEKFSQYHVCLPMHNAMTVQDAKKVALAVQRYFRGA